MAAEKHNITVICPDGSVTVAYIDGTHSEPGEFATVNAEDMIRGFNSPYDYQAAFLDADGNALVNTVVKFKVNGKEYTAVTNKEGIAQLTTSTLAVGKYSITSINTVTGEEVTKELEIVKRIVGNKDVTMDFMGGTYFVVKVIGDDGNIAPEGEIIDIWVNGRHYVSKVDANGLTRLKINLNPQTYTITAEYKTYKTTNKTCCKTNIIPCKTSNYSQKR